MMAFDVIGVGTSPLMLMRAVRLAELGERVLLCDRAPIIGGAWAAPDLLGVGNVEVGVHLLENRTRLMAALTRNLGLELQQDPCFGQIGDRRLAMAPTRVLLHMIVACKAAARGETDKCQRVLRSAWRALFSGGVGFQYPRLGASAITQRLQERFLDLGGRVSLGAEVIEIDARGSGVRCMTSHGAVEAKRALIGSRAFAPISIDGAPIAFDVERSMSLSAVLRLVVVRRKPFSYVEILGDPHIKRVRDIGGFVTPALDEGDLLVCVQYRRPLVGDDVDLGRYLVGNLARLGLVAGFARIDGLARSELHVTTLTDRALGWLSKASGGRIEPLYTTDFAEGFISLHDQLQASANGI